MKKEEIAEDSLISAQEIGTEQGAAISGGAVASMQTLIETLPKQEKRAAEFLLNNLQTFSARPIQEMATAAGVSDATYIRLAKRLGYSGFAEFKRNLIVDLVSFSDPIQEVDKKDDAEKVLTKVLQSDSQWLYDSLKVIDVDTFDRVAHLILKFDRIVVWAVGMSTPCGIYLQQRLLRLGRVCSFLSDPYEMEVQSEVLDEKTMVFTVSRTGWPNMLFTACSKAKIHGATVCLLSGQQDTNLAKLADHTLLTSTRSFKPSVLTSGVATLAVIDALFVMISLLKQDRDPQEAENGTEAEFEPD